MSEDRTPDTRAATDAAFEQHCQQLFAESVRALDLPTRSRLTRARHGALESALPPSRAERRVPIAAMMAVAVLSVVVWFAMPQHQNGGADAPGFEELDLVAATEDPAGDALEMLQNDLDFYYFSERAASVEPAA